MARFGVRTQTHYEVFEEEPSFIPDYLLTFPSLREFDQRQAGHPRIPRRSNASETYGWGMDIFFCEAPEYLRSLYKIYRTLGGNISNSIPGQGGLSDYLSLDYQFYINCLGHSAISFLEDASMQGMDAPGDGMHEPLADPFEAKFIKGHYLRLETRHPSITDQSGRFVSYNYTPLPQVYRHTSGLAADVYCYPRSDAWILGGSRQEVDGVVNLEEPWEKDSTSLAQDETQMMFASKDGRGLAIPRAIFDVNADILLGLSEGSLDLRKIIVDRPESLTAGVGYRFVRSSPTESIRLASSRVLHRGEKYVLHNYGHGGSGYTLSWGCAYDILRILDNIGPESMWRPKSGDTEPQGDLSMGSMLAQLTKSIKEGDQ